MNYFKGIFRVSMGIDRLSIQILYILIMVSIVYL